MPDNCMALQAGTAIARIIDTTCMPKVFQRQKSAVKDYSVLPGCYRSYSLHHPDCDNYILCNIISLNVMISYPFNLKSGKTFIWYKAMKDILH